MMPKYFTYKIINNINGKIYIGITQNPEKRWKKHKKTANQKRNKERFYIHRAIFKYGEENFSFFVIEEKSSLEKAFLSEKHWIKKLRTKEAGYNLTDGGEGAFGRRLSKNTKEKISASHIGMRHSNKTKQLLKEINTGKKHSDETKRKISTKIKGRVLSDEHKNKLKNIKKPKSNDQKRKTASTLKHKYQSDKNFRLHLIEIGKKAANSPNRIVGSKSKNAKLKEVDILRIRDLCRNGLGAKKIAKLFNVSKRTVGYILSGSTWKHVK